MIMIMVQKLYKGDPLIFKGNGWSGILFFLRNKMPKLEQFNN